MSRDVGGTPTALHIADEIRRKMESLSKTERRVARVLLSNYPAAGLETAAQLAQMSNASAPTVTRFIAKLGFDDYRQFQQSVRAEIDARRLGPMHAPPPFAANAPAAGVLAESAQVASSLLGVAFDSIPPSEFDQAIRLLCDTRNRLHGVGGRFSKVLASFWELHLRMLRSGCDVLEMTAEGSAAQLIDIGRRDVFMVFDFRRYQSSSVDFCARVHARQCRIILVTDLWLSPIAEIADVVLPLETDNGTPFDSLIPAVALIETIAAVVLAELGDSAYARMRMIDEIHGVT